MCEERVGVNKTQIVHSCNLNFHTVVPYLELLIRNGLAEKIDTEVVRYQTTAKGLQVLGCFRQIEEAITEMRAKRGQAREGGGAEDARMQESCGN